MKKKFYNKFYKIKNVLSLRKSITFYECISQIKNILFYNSKHFNEVSKSFGQKNEDKTFYIIRRTPPGAGLFSNYLLILMHLYYANEMGYEAIIDYKNYSNFYKEKEKINNTLNSWEYYFKQPTRTPLEEVYKSKNVILSKANVSHELASQHSLEDLNDIGFIGNEKLISEYYLITESIKLNQDTNNFVSETLNKVFTNKTKILGVVLRGTDYLNKKLSRGHHTPLNVIDSIELVENNLQKWNLDYVYLSTEVEEYINIYKDHFGENLMYLVRDRYNNDQNEKLINQYTRSRKNDKYLTGLEYLTEVYGLSKCDSIIGTVCGSLNSAIILNNNKYNNKIIYDQGKNFE